MALWGLVTCSSSSGTFLCALVALYTLAEHCGYGDLHSEMIRDCIMVGICNSKLSERMQLDPKLTLESTVTQVRQAKAMKLQQPLLKGSGVEKLNLPVGTIQRGKGGGKGKPFKSQGSQNTNHKPYNSTGCSWCGKTELM